MSGAGVSAGEAPVGVCQECAGSTFVILMGGKFAVDVLVLFGASRATAAPQHTAAHERPQARFLFIL